MKSFICFKRRANRLAFALFALTLGCISIATNFNYSSNKRRDSAFLVAEAAAAATANENTSLSSYLSSARQLLASSLDAHSQAQTYSGLVPNEDPRTAQMLRDTIDKTSSLIRDYQHDGLTSMPPVTNLPGLNTIMRLPDKVLRAELSMLQDGIRMAQEMRERPITATMNTPRELSNMLLRMLHQLNQ